MTQAIFTQCLSERKNKTGSTSIQILKKVGRKNILVKTIGSSSDSEIIDQLYKEGLRFIEESMGQLH